jgi:hypothetical protein
LLCYYFLLSFSHDAIPPPGLIELEPSAPASSASSAPAPKPKPKAWQKEDEEDNQSVDELWNFYDMCEAKAKVMTTQRAGTHPFLFDQPLLRPT